MGVFLVCVFFKNCLPIPKSEETAAARLCELDWMEKGWVRFLSLSLSLVHTMRAATGPAAWSSSSLPVGFLRAGDGSGNANAFAGTACGRTTNDKEIWLRFRFETLCHCFLMPVVFRYNTSLF